MPAWRAAFAWALLVPALAWGVGQCASDRWWWSQWLFWIPPAVPLMCTLGAVPLLWRGPHRDAASTRRGARGWTGVALNLAVCAAVIATGAATMRWISWGRTGDGVQAASHPALRIVHLNARWPGDATQLGAAIMSRPADVHAISEAGAVLRAPAVRAAADAGATAIQVGRFAVISRCPVIEARAVYDDGAIAASWIRFGPTGSLPEWSMLMVDAPRRLGVSRSAIFGTLRAALDAMPMPAPDIVIGDMNTTPGSVAVRGTWPMMADACEESGRGLRATFPRAYPLWAIDRCLAGPAWEPVSWIAWDPGIGAHRGQEITLVANGTVRAQAPGTRPQLSP